MSIQQLNDELKKEKAKLEEKLRVETLMSSKLGGLETLKHELNEKVAGLEKDLATAVTTYQAMVCIVDT
jgi:chromosome segregation ATPase